jgi:predicted transcriptional regulator
MSNQRARQQWKTTNSIQRLVMARKGKTMNATQKPSVWDLFSNLGQPEVSCSMRFCNAWREARVTSNAALTERGR